MGMSGGGAILHTCNWLPPTKLHMQHCFMKPVRAMWGGGGGGGGMEGNQEMAKKCWSGRGSV